MSDFEHVFEAPPEGAAADWTIPQDWSAYTEVEHRTWDTLYARQMKILPGRAADVFLKGLTALDLNTGGIPDFETMNPKLQALTGWTGPRPSRSRPSCRPTGSSPAAPRPMPPRAGGSRPDQSEWTIMLRCLVSRMNR